MDDLSLAADLAREAGQLAASMLADGLETEYKTSVSDVVSAADHAAEEMITSRLAEHRPDDGIVGEEGARRPGRERTWYVDPVDGTYNFLSRLPYWCSAVGLADADGPLVGAVYFPPRDELWVGGRDAPTTLNGVPLAELADRPLADVSVATHSNPRLLADGGRFSSWRAVTAGAATVRMLGSASVDLAGVASGRLGIFLQANLNPWDWVPGAALVMGAGGIAEEFPVDGVRWQIAGNRQSVADAAAALGR
ncbi:MAG TPA: inositol monophosphatase [Propionibacteriaceae bacterium]|nr:inositol monophosphatase [Propionibacteriaceae bacterium]